MDDGAYKIDRDVASSLLAMADNLAQEAPRASLKAIINIDSS
jgi:hypothetical protein